MNLKVAEKELVAQVERGMMLEIPCKRAAAKEIINCFWFLVTHRTTIRMREC
jgi:hypothetical protein